VRRCCASFHHSLTDGVGGVQIGMTLFDLSELSGEHETLPAPPEVARLPWVSGYRDVFGYDAGLVATAVAGAITSAPETDLQQHPTPTGDHRVLNGHSGLPSTETVRPVNRTGSPPMKNRTLTRRLGVHQVADAATAGAGPP